MRYVLLLKTDLHDEETTMCFGTTKNRFKAIGKIVSTIEDNNYNWLENGYELVKQTDFLPEGDNGYVWSRTYTNKICNKTIHERYYLLEEEEDTTTYRIETQEK